MLCQGTHGRRRRRAALPEAELVRAEQLQVALGGRGGYRARQAVAITDERRGQVGSSRMALFRVGAVYAGNVILFFDGAMFWQVADLGSPVPSTRAVGPGLAQAPGGCGAPAAVEHFGQFHGHPSPGDERGPSRARFIVGRRLGKARSVVGSLAAVATASKRPLSAYVPGATARVANAASGAGSAKQNAVIKQHECGDRCCFVRRGAIPFIINFLLVRHFES